MSLQDIVLSLQLKILSGNENLARVVNCACVSDMLSDVMSKAPAGCLWVTNQNHENVIAIAFFKELAGIIFPAQIVPDEETLEKARGKGIPVFCSDLSAFEIVGRLYELGVRGKN
jgi:hypothetical protein